MIKAGAKHLEANTMRARKDMENGGIAGWNSRYMITVPPLKREKAALDVQRFRM